MWFFLLFHQPNLGIEYLLLNVLMQGETYEGNKIIQDEGSINRFFVSFEIVSLTEGVRKLPATPKHIIL